MGEKELTMILIPVVVITFTLVVAALADLRKQTATRGPKWMWVIIICTTWTTGIGPLAYFIIGRKDE